jgi:hypothetical protein
MIPQVLSLGATLVQVATSFGADKKNVEGAKKIIDGAAATYNVLQTGNVSKSASKTLISPLVAIEDSLLHQDFMSDLMTVVNLRDINDTLSHFAQQGSVNGIKISDLIDGIQPRRAGFLSLQGAEAFDMVTGVESAPPVKRPQSNVGSKMAEMSEYRPLAVGRTVDASVTIDGNQLTFPLTFRQTPVSVTSKDLQNIFEAARPEDGWKARMVMARSGELTTPELLGGEDVIKREFKLRKNDTSGYYTEVTERESKNRMAALRTGVISMNSQANTIILTSETARNIELELGVRFDSSGIDKIRKAVLANTIIVVNQDLGVFTFYYSGNNMPEEWTQRQITVTSKRDTSMDLTSLAKLFGGR